MSSNIEEPSPSSRTLEIQVPSRESRWLVEVQDEAGSRGVPLMGARVVVGTSPTVDIVIRDPTVSARHCALSVLGAGVVIEDLGSTNGTFVGSARVREAWGSAGTTVTIGHSSIILEPADPSPSSGPPGEPLPGVVGASTIMRHLADQVRRLAQHGLPVLVSGESGTGKELVARAIHEQGPRRFFPFVAINVTALPRDLVESELFGHERGAFTGAHSRRLGAFAEAAGGTLFLDEIGDLPLDAQPKLLRALDGYEVRRVGAKGGGDHADVRVVAATHAPLEQRVAAGTFRRDLFHRLECFVVQVPPLRERRGDVASIAREILAQIAPQVGLRSLTPAAVARLAAYDWPGNVRELRNVLCRAADATQPSAVIDAEDIDRCVRREGLPAARALTPGEARAILAEHGGNLSAAAKSARLPRTSFRRLVYG